MYWDHFPGVSYLLLAIAATGSSTNILPTSYTELKLIAAPTVRLELAPAPPLCSALRHCGNGIRWSYVVKISVPATRHKQEDVFNTSVDVPTKTSGLGVNNRSK
jgi:hypothetical protein